MSKRGLSNLIATVLIVLLTLAAVAIVWSFFRPPLERTGPQVDLGIKCINSEVRVLNCTHYQSTSVTSVLIQHSRGQDVVGAIVTVEYNDGTVNAATERGLQLFASRVVTISGSGADAVSAGAAPIVGDSSNNEDICEEQLLEINCAVVV